MQSVTWKVIIQEHFATKNPNVGLLTAQMVLAVIRAGFTRRAQRVRRDSSEIPSEIEERIAFREI